MDLARPPRAMSVVSLPRTQHDALARYVFGRPKAAAILLRHVLPPSLLDALDLGSLRRIPASTTRPSLGPRDSDLLFEADLRGIRAPPVRIPIDHQSTPDGLIPWRTLVYAGEQWGSYVHAAQHPCPLPLVLPVLIVQPPARATPSQLSEILAVPPELRTRLVSPIDLSIYVDDLSVSVLGDPVADRGHLALVEATRTLLYAYRNDEDLILPRLQPLGELFDTIVDHFGPEPEEARELLAYVTGTLGADSPIHAIIMQTFARESREMYMTLADQLHAKGRAEAKAEAVLDVLARRGLEPTSVVRERVLATTDERLLQRWFDRAFTATAPDELFGRPG